MKKLSVIFSLMFFWISTLTISAMGEESRYPIPPEDYNNPAFEYQYEIQEFGNKKLIGMTYDNIYYKYNRTINCKMRKLRAARKFHKIFVEGVFPLGIYVYK